MCLQATRKEINQFKAEHQDDEVITVWKVYGVDKKNKRLRAPFASSRFGGIPGLFVKSSGTVTSNRLKRKLQDCVARDFYDPFSKHWDVHRGIHVFTKRSDAVKFLNYRQGWHEFKKAVVICCKANMSDFVAYNKPSDQAVFMKITVSQRNFRKAMTGK